MNPGEMIEYKGPESFRNIISQLSWLMDIEGFTRIPKRIHVGSISGLNEHLELDEGFNDEIDARVADTIESGFNMLVYDGLKDLCTRCGLGALPGMYLTAYDTIIINPFYAASHMKALHDESLDLSLTVSLDTGDSRWELPLSLMITKTDLMSIYLTSSTIFEFGDTEYSEATRQAFFKGKPSYDRLKDGSFSGFMDAFAQETPEYKELKDKYEDLGIAGVMEICCTAAEAEFFLPLLRMRHPDLDMREIVIMQMAHLKQDNPVEPGLARSMLYSANDDPPSFIPRMKSAADEAFRKDRHVNDVLKSYL